MAVYDLAEHVHACVLSDSVILLDLRRDEYMSLTAMQARALHRFVRGLNAKDATNYSHPLLNHDEHALREHLAKAGTIVSADPCKSMRTGSSPPLPEKTLIPEHDSTQVTITATVAISCVLSAMQSYIELKWLSLNFAIHSLRQRKTRVRPASRCNEIRLQELTLIFSAMRPFLFASKDNCLLDSLTLANFLLRNGFRTDLILGVKSTPFEAHAWVQYETAVLNSAAGYVRRYSPILAI
jgi:Transglutaminase-like superfamily